MTHVAIIACDHGLGHVRRCYRLAQELLQRGSTVDLFAPRAKIDRIQQTLGEAPGLNAVEFATRTTPRALASGANDSLHWPHRLPNLDGYDHVVSDTLPEILEQRTDAIILAQFFWHDVLDDLPKWYVARCHALLGENEPRVFGSELFTMPAVRRQHRFSPVGLYGPSEVRPASPPNRRALLLSPGSTQRARGAFEVLIRRIVETNITPEIMLYVDPDILPPDHPIWMEAFDYSPAAFERIRAVVCRPGLGVLTDALWYGLLPICFTTDSNREMGHNARIIAREGLGHHCENLEDALQVVLPLLGFSSGSSVFRRLRVSEFTAAAELAQILAEPTIPSAAQ